LECGVIGEKYALWCEKKEPTRRETQWGATRSKSNDLLLVRRISLGSDHLGGLGKGPYASVQIHPILACGVQIFGL